MKWQTKAFALRALSKIYGGEHVYLSVQSLLGTTKARPKLALRQSAELINLVLENGSSIEDRVCLDIGTGWYAFAPLAYYLVGAKKVITLDVNPWLSLGRVRETIVHAESQLSMFAEAVGADEEEIRRRYTNIKTSFQTKEELLAQFNTEYWYPADAGSLRLDDSCIDIVSSSNVLEHIPYDTLKKIGLESFRVLKPSGCFVHRFDPGDHFMSMDSSITSANFLQFSSTQWKKYSEGLAYHNRLRCSQYKQLFAECGFEKIAEQISVDEKAVKAIETRELVLSAEYSDFQIQDLAAHYMRYLGRKSCSIQ